MAPETVGYMALWTGNPDFRRLFLARMVSLFGDWFNLLAVLALLREIGAVSASSFGAVLILKTLPIVFALPFAGLVVDRMPRTLVMIGADVARAAVVALMLLIAWWPNPMILYALVVCQAVASAFFEPARNALLPDIVEAGALTAANAMGAAMWSTMLAFGSAAGGLLTAWLGWKAAIGVDIFTYLLSAVFLWQIREPAHHVVTQATARPAEFLRDLAGGALYLSRRPRARSLALVKAAWSTAGAITLVLTVLGEHRLSVAGMPLVAVSVLYVARGIGTGLGPFVARRISRSEPAAMERLITVGFGMGGLAYLLLPWAPSLAPAALIVVFGHVGGATVWVFSTIRLQQMVPTAVRGRVFAIENAAFTVVVAASTAVWGWATDRDVFSLEHATMALGVVLTAAGAWWALRGWRLGWATQPPEPGSDPLNSPSD